MPVSIKEIKKGARVQLRNGWEAQVEDNAVNQQTRVCTVYGFETEMGSVYENIDGLEWDCSFPYEEEECELTECECDNTHQANDTVCRWCWAHGRRHWNDPEVTDDTL